MATLYTKKPSIEVVPLTEVIGRYTQEPDKTEIMNMIHFLDSSHGAWHIVGGSAQKIWQNNPLGDSDIDIVASSIFQMTKHIERNIYKRTIISSRASTFVPPSGRNIQLLNRPFDILHVFSMFDFNCCKVGFNSSSFFIHPLAIPALENKELNITYPLSISRTLKYIKQGYKFPIEDQPKLLSDLILAIKGLDEAEYFSNYDPSS